MPYDLKQIKKYYGENMAHLCRRLFPTLLEKEGFLFELIESKFAHSKTLYDTIMFEELEDEFQDYIYSLTEEPTEPVDTGKSVEELLDMAGYVLYECKAEEDIQKFKHFYQEDEELCTFNGDRLKSCHVFFAVKKNVDLINRDDFSYPRRQDEYGTSVISIQFTRGECNTLSIKNRYNHTVRNPDATFKNNLENIIPGLTRAFEHDYGLNINQNIGNFKSDSLVMAGDGRFYEYHFESDAVYYGPNNVIIDKFKVQEEFLDKSRYIVIGVLVLDLKEKIIYNYSPKTQNVESMPKYIGNIKKVDVTNIEAGNKKVIITNDKNEDTILILSPENNVLGFINNYIKEISDKSLLFLAYNIKYFEARSVEKIGDAFLNGGSCVEQFIAPNLKRVGNGFLAFNRNVLKKLDCPKLEKVGNNFMGAHDTYRISGFDKRVSVRGKIKYIEVTVRNKVTSLKKIFQDY